MIATPRCAAVAVVTLLTGALLATSAPAQEGEARRMYLNAQRLEREGQLDSAMGEYRFLAEQFPTSEWADDALLQVALTQWRTGAAEEAAATAQSLRSAYPSSPGGAGALYLLAQISLARARTPEELAGARDDFRRVALAFPAQRYPALTWRGLAKARAGEISLMLGEQVEAAGILIDTIDNEPGTLAAGHALVAFSELLALQGDWKAAGQALQQVVEAAGGDEEGWDELRARASRRASLLNRVMVRPAAGQSPWTRAFPWVPSGVELDRPVGVAADTEGRLIVADEGEDLVLVANVDRTVVARRALQDPRKPWWTSDGVAMALTKTYAARVDSRESTTFAIRSGRDAGPLQEIIAGATNLYREWLVIDDKTHRMVLFDPAGQQVATPFDSARSEPVDVALDRAGRIYVLDRERRNVVRYRRDGTPDGTFAGGDWRRPEALVIDDLDNVYVLDRDARTIRVFGPDGARRAAIGPSLPGGLELRDPRDLAIDGSGRLYVADRDREAITLLQ